MTIGERLKYLRKDLLHLTGEQFSAPLGVGRSSISNIESGGRDLTDQMVKSICHCYNVSEEWLRTGEGEPFAPQTTNQKIIAFINNALEENDDGTQKRVLDHLSKMSPQGWAAIKTLLDEWGL